MVSGAHPATAAIQATRATERTILSRACPATKTANAHETESCAPMAAPRPLTANAHETESCAPVAAPRPLRNLFRSDQADYSRVPRALNALRPGPLSPI